MEAQFPDTGSTEADEGTACHNIAAAMLAGGPVPPVGQRCADTGVILTEEIIQAAQVYVDAVRNRAGSNRLQIEQLIPVPMIHPECFGTPDCWWFDQHHAEIHVADLKFGWGIVEAVRNWQLVTYATGVMELVRPHHSAPGVFDQHVTVCMHIVQPRPYHVLGPVRTWRVSGSDLRGLVNQLVHSAEVAMGGNPTTHTGEHCKYCNARHACPSAQQAALAACDYCHEAVPEFLPPEALAMELHYLKHAEQAIQHRLTAIEAQVAGVIEGGGHIPGWMLDRGPGKVVWNVPDAEVIAMGGLMGIKLQRDPAPVTVVQARRLTVPPEVLAAYSEQQPGALKIVPSDKTVAARVFGMPG